MTAIKEKIEDQLGKIHLQHIKNKNRSIKVFLNIELFQYLCYEMSEYALKLMTAHMSNFNINSILSLCTRVFNITFTMVYKHKIQKSLKNPENFF